jgi:hypothetical protein
VVQQSLCPCSCQKFPSTTLNNVSDVLEWYSETEKWHISLAGGNINSFATEYIAEKWHISLAGGNINSFATEYIVCSPHNSARLVKLAVNHPKI